MALTALKVKNIGPGRHADAHGLYLLVKDSGTRSWVLRLQYEGRRRDFGLGSVRDVSLAEARDAAADLRRQVRRGDDPIADRKRSRFVMPSFETAAQAIRSCGASSELLIIDAAAGTSEATLEIAEHADVIVQP